MSGPGNNDSSRRAFLRFRGFWNQKDRKWEPLGSEYRNSIRDGLRIARKQAAPDLVKLPIIAPEPAK